MFMKLFPLYFLLVEMLSSYDLSPVNVYNNQHQLPITNKLVNQPTLSTMRSIVSTDIKWIKTLKNITENGGRPVVLECQVKSSYPVRFNWYRYNNPIDPNRFIITDNSFRSSIRLKNFKESISGFYTCEVSNDYQTVTSTGFVRVKNPNNNPVHFPDDFQPEIIASNDQTIDQLKCEIYQGDICRPYLTSKYVSVSSLDIEQSLVDNIRILSKQCQEFLLPMICLFVYPICDENGNDIRSICRKSCFYYRNHSCMREFANLQNLPTCENLPPSSDDRSCLKIHQVSSSSSIKRFFTPFNSLPLVLLSICLPLLLICLLISIVCYCCCRRNNKRKKHVSTSRTKSSHLLSSPFHSTIHQNITTSSLSSTNTNLTNFNHRQMVTLTSRHSLEEIPFGNIRLLQEIGEGEFGRLYFGELIDTATKCVIKSLENEEMKQNYAREIEVFRHIHHENISNLVGICLNPENAFSLALNEYLNNGDLHEYLVQQRSKSIDLLDFLHISVQIVAGMIYLSERNFLHNDLSARNIFISDHLDIKITNTARYRRKYHSDYYKLVNRVLPVRWMSIESLLTGIYSEMSDVWSFGVLLWEMFSYGTQPYHRQTSPEVIEMIRDRQLLPCPNHCPKRIYALMCSCWEEISDQRPTFIELMRRLKHLEEKSKTELISINQIESPTAKYRTSVTSNGRVMTQAVLTDRNSFRFQV